MKRLIINVFFFLPIIVSAQVKLLNTNLTKPDSGILYFSTENRINISGLANLDNIKFATSLSKLDRKKNDFILMPERVGIDTIKIYKNNKLILKTFFKVVKINDPIAKLVSTSDSVITVNEILGNPYILVKYRTAVIR